MVSEMEIEGKVERGRKRSKEKRICMRLTERGRWDGDRKSTESRLCKRVSLQVD